jgi:hypothetical protein
MSTDTAADLSTTMTENVHYFTELLLEFCSMRYENIW